MNTLGAEQPQDEDQIIEQILKVDFGESSKIKANKKAMLKEILS